VLTCPNCGEENPERAKFCLNCGTALRPEERPEERKVVSVLFCDLVGFTSASDRADPEDVKARLRPFHAEIKSQIEAFGGTLDKFIGDAALGVFGTPRAHEDDPERAVRTALAIIDSIDKLNESDPALDLAVRVGINTGEAVVAYGTGPQIGEAVTGDVVNTASRLQGVAPVGGIVVGEPTFRATKEVFVYESLPPVTVKGKAEPLSIWRVIEARGRFGAEFTRTHTAPFVGRTAERRLLLDTFARVVEERAVRLVIVSGGAGVGKSRLVSEMGRALDESPDLVTWRQGRCLPYGEGVTFWPLGEILKAHAGIFESDSPDEAAAKLDAVIPEDEPDRKWLRQRLSPLVGAEASVPAEREESFAAWRRFLERMAATNPAILVFEDIHWADPAMLDFIEHVAQTARDSALLVACTTRPDLFERHPSWPDHGATRINLFPLSSDETARLISSVLDDAIMPAEVQELVLERVEGNPLFAQEFARLLVDRGLLVRRGNTVALAPDGEIPFPESIQALIAARLDMVAGDRKAVLQDASVIGKVFWADAVESLGDRAGGSVREALDDLTHRELVVPVGSTSMKGHEEYAFAHGLVRDVAYSQIPRAVRSVRHRTAAEWIEHAVGDRLEDHAEVLAHHYTQALDLGRAAGRPLDLEAMEAAALRFVVMAGDRALGLDVSRAEKHYARALELASPDHPHRPVVLTKWADAVRQSGRAPEAATAFEEAIEQLLATGNRLGAARAMGTLSSVYLTMGDERQADVAAEAVRLLEAEPPGADLVAAYARMAGVQLVLGNHPETQAWADRALALAEDLPCEIPARALGFRGFARASLGDAHGVQDIRAALNLAVERAEGRDAAVQYNNLAVALWPIEGPATVLATLREGIDFSRRRGITEFASGMEAASLDQLVELGEWDQVLQQAAEMAGPAEATGDFATLLQARWAQVRVLAYRGDTDEVRPLADWLIDAARRSGAAEDVLGGLGTAALAYGLLGDPQRARQLLAELGESPNLRQSPAYPSYLPELVRTSVGAGDPGLAAALASGVKAIFPYWEHALATTRGILAEADGRLRDAADAYGEVADRWRRFGVVLEEAHAHLGRGRCLVEVGEAGAGNSLLDGRALFAKLGARPLVTQCDELLQRGTARTS
jgi:class 3 adenylate cyclase/tetratricopeptide (TPR) repeat protein